MPTSIIGRAVVVAVALVAATLADVVVGASWPGRIAAVAFAASIVLVIGSKSLVAPIVSRPAGSRVGELGDPCGDPCGDLRSDPLTASPVEEVDRG
jgi:hypothetical protein